MTQKMQSRIVDALERVLEKFNFSLDDAEFQYRGQIATVLETDEGEIKNAVQVLRRRNERRS